MLHFLAIAVAGAVSAGARLLLPRPKQVIDQRTSPEMPQTESGTPLPEVYNTARVSGHFFFV